MNVANITLFDADRIRDVGTFEDPHHYPEGIPYVFVNGVAVVDGGKFTAARPGRVLRHDQRGSAHTAGSSIPSTHTE